MPYLRAGDALRMPLLRAGDAHTMPHLRAGDAHSMPRLRAGDAFRMPILMSKIRKMMKRRIKETDVFHHEVVFMTAY